MMLRRVMWLAVYAVAVLAVMRPVVDPDLWWHLRTGEWIVRYQSIPSTDPFSTAGPDKPWIAYSWLFDLPVYGLYRAWGLTGILVFRLAMTLAIVFAFQCLAARRETHSLVAILLTGAATVALVPVLNERSWLFSILFCAFTLLAVLALREGDKTWTVWLLPIVYVLWASIHIQFVYGLFLLGLACVAPFLDRVFGLADPATQDWRRPLLLLVLCALATLVNPYGYRVYEAVWEAITQPGPAAFIDEMKAMEFRYPAEWAALLLGLAGAFALGRRARLSTFEVLFLLAASYCAFRAKRDVWFLALAALAIIPPVARAPAESQKRVVLWGILGLAWVGFFALCLVWSRDLGESRLREEVGKEFPTRAVAEVRELALPGPVYNPFNWGGYLMWELKDRRVTIDGRCSLHGDTRILHVGDMWAGLGDVPHDPDLRAAAVVIGERNTRLAALLRADERFLLVHEDALAVVFVRRAPGTIFRNQIELKQD
jgi:hypothetical protein